MNIFTSILLVCTVLVLAADQLDASSADDLANVDSESEEDAKESTASKVKEWLASLFAPKTSKKWKSVSKSVPTSTTSPAPSSPRPRPRPSVPVMSSPPFSPHPIFSRPSDVHFRLSPYLPSFYPPPVFLAPGPLPKSPSPLLYAVPISLLR